MSTHREREDENIIRTLVEYCDTHPDLTISARDLLRVFLDVDEILGGRNPRKLLDVVDRISDSGNE